MADVKEFNLDGVAIDVKDTVARNAASGVAYDVTQLAGRVSALENLSHLTVSYDAATEVISFTTT